MKVSIIGAGNVGATTALRILETDLADVVLFDIAKGLAEGKAMDMRDSNAVKNIDKKIYGTQDYADLKDSDIVVITAGFSRKPGMAREDLLAANVDIIRDISRGIKPVSKDSIIIVVTNPLDVMAYLVKSLTGFDSNKVFGMAGELDSARARAVVKEMTGVKLNTIDVAVLGGHSPDLMVTILSRAKVNGKLICEIMKAEHVDEFKYKFTQRGTHIVNFLGSGSAYYGPSASIFKMVEIILKDKKEIVLASAYLTGQYGINDVYMGVPVILGRDGIEKILEFELEENELMAMRKSADFIKDNIRKLVI